MHVGGTSQKIVFWSHCVPLHAAVLQSHCHLAPEATYILRIWSMIEFGEILRVGLFLIYIYIIKIVPLDPGILLDQKRFLVWDGHILDQENHSPWWLHAIEAPLQLPAQLHCLAVPGMRRFEKLTHLGLTHLVLVILRLDAEDYSMLLQGCSGKSFRSYCAACQFTMILCWDSRGLALI